MIKVCAMIGHQNLYDYILRTKEEDALCTIQSNLPIRVYLGCDLITIIQAFLELSL
jgi:hypothetical protein